METRYATGPNDVKRLTTDELRKQFMVEKIFVPGEITLTYTHHDRMIFGGVVPTGKELSIKLDKELGVDYFLERRELGLINIGGDGTIVLDGEKHEVNNRDGFYVGKETKELIFDSVDPNKPAKFYVVSTPAHKKYPTVKLDINKMNPLEKGEQSTLNERKIYQYIHPNNCESCQLQMGYTILEPGSTWNTMPAHTHDRRMEVYLYFNMEQNTRAFHFMGEPDETRHLVMANEQAAISPSWSIHCGVATADYTFIWAMCGENITYDDMDHVDMGDLK
ncbi:5-dehydro-4-deoxy-D-glucuronate isomerase [Marinilactibacillus sp. XAAS-LB27]|uniref:5-dehydro-4-deoxy-D-glucuronate isomerase n=1 Tax=Marinilactibacillus sp. XAAS-LB27 TaxID=3114538 RepID=UPI002E1985E3|nr:5-dehydro-4-deoxy-D-glucuronate isomerase [Marinilactibacillus sp. XAAS-LB27]